MGQDFTVEVKQPKPCPEQADYPAPTHKPPEGLNRYPAGVIQGAERSAGRRVVPGDAGDDQVEAEMGIHVQSGQDNGPHQEYWAVPMNDL